MPSSDKRKYAVTLGKKRYSFYPGEQAKIDVLYYIAQAGATYAFYLGDEPLTRDGQFLIFTMPAQDVEITYIKRACALASPPNPWVQSSVPVRLSPSPGKASAAFCTHCGTALPNKANFCPECGAPVGR